MSFNNALSSIYADLVTPPPPSQRRRSSSPVSPTATSAPPPIRDALSFPSADFLAPYLPTRPHISRPFLTLTFATSLDSCLSLAPGVQTPLSGPQSKAMTHFLRSRHDAILVGAGTAVADDPSLNCRLQGVGGYGADGLVGQPRPVVLDPRGRWDVSGSKVLGLAREGRGRAPWVVTKQRPVGGEGLEEAGGEWIVLPAELRGGKEVFDWGRVMAELRKRGVGSVMVEGGGAVINSLLTGEDAGLVDAVVVTIAPTWLGEGGVVVSPPRSGAVPVARLQKPKWQQLGDDVVLCGYLK